MLDTSGLLFAVVAIVGWGIYMVPMKMARGANVLLYQAIMTVGIFLTTVAASLLFGFSFSIVPLGMASGLMWGAGGYLFTRSIDKAGLSIVSPTVMSGVVLTSFLSGLFIFHDQISVIYMAVAGIALLIAGVTVASRVHGSSSGKSLTAGLLMGAAAGIVFGAYLVPMKLSQLPLQDMLFSMSIGIAACAWSIFFVMRGRFDRGFPRNALVSGTLWNFANVGSLFAVGAIGLAIAFPITQLSVILPIALGALYFKEIRRRKDLLKIAVGSAMLIVGAFLLALSKA